MYKIVVLGVDGLNPQRISQWLDDLPSLKKMQQEGIWGDIESTMPPTAPQAWISSQCGQNPGAYGLWGYTYRDDFSYAETKSADSRVIDDRVDCLYKILPKMGQKVALINVPLTWPLPEIPGGYCVSDFVPKNNEIGFTWPESLSSEVNNLVGEYMFDVFDTALNPRLTDRGKMVGRIYETDAQRLTLLAHFAHERNCDYVFAVLTGAKRIHARFCRGFENNDSGPDYEDVLHDYYKWIDTNLGKIRESLDRDSGLFVYSPYCVQRGDGHINLNEWLIDNGYMTLHQYPVRPTPMKNLNIDWAKTRCWSTGNSGKVYINLKGRETHGIVEPDDYDRLLDELRDKLSEVHDKNGQVRETQVLKREENQFGKYEEYGPDMFVHIHKVPWNTNEWVGYGSGEIFASGQRGDSDGEYDGLYGYFCVSGSGVPAIGELKEISVLNIAPTVMEVLRLEIPAHMEKPSILSVAKKKETESSVSRKERVRSRLKALGY